MDRDISGGNAVLKDLILFKSKWNGYFVGLMREAGLPLV